MSLTIKVTVVDGGLRAVMLQLTRGGFVELNRAAGTELQTVAFEHVAKLAAERHGTAEKLGATPTNHYAQAAEKIAAPAALSADAAGATLAFSHPGFTRAFRSVKIAPTTSRSLALPIHAISYGHRAAALWERLGLFIPKGKRFIAANIGGVLTPLYVLVRSLTQKQDRSLLPSDEQFQAAAAAGAKGWLGMALAKGGKL